MLAAPGGGEGNDCSGGEAVAWQCQQFLPRRQLEGDRVVLTGACMLRHARRRLTRSMLTLPASSREGN